MGDWFAKQTLGSLPADPARRWGSREALYFRRRRRSFGEHVALWMTGSGKIQKARLREEALTRLQ